MSDVEVALRITCGLTVIPLLFLSFTSSAIGINFKSDTIVVRGTRIDPAKARQRAVDFVKSAGVAHGQKQVARWVVPVCIKAVGVKDAQPSGSNE